MVNVWLVAVLGLGAVAAFLLLSRRKKKKLDAWMDKISDPFDESKK